MHIVDLDSVDWSKTPKEFMDYSSADALKKWLYAQPTATVYVLTQSQHPAVKAKAIEAAMDLNRFIIDIIQLLAYQSTGKGGKT